jgi:hypothetical protein
MKIIDGVSPQARARKAWRPGYSFGGVPSLDRVNVIVDEWPSMLGFEGLRKGW